MRILIHSNSPWMASGYGSQCAEMLRHLTALGVQCAVSCNAGLHQGEFRVPDGHGGSISVYPAGIDDSGSSVILGHVNAFRPDYVISLYDACGMHSQAPGGQPGIGWGRFNFPWVPYGMVDDGPPLAGYHRESLEGARFVLTLTRWAERQLQPWADSRGIPLLYAPHSLDPEVFKPVPKVKARAALGIPPGNFVIAFAGDWEGWPGRKGVIETIEAFSMLGHEMGFSGLTLLLHTKPMISNPQMSLIQLRDHFDIPESSWVQEPSHFQIVGRPVSHMVNVYSAADIFCLPSRAEGFGLTALEAEMCGTPTIVTDGHASQEVCFGPFKVKPLGSMLSWKCSRWEQVGSAPVFEALRVAATMDSEQLAVHGKSARERAIESYSSAVVRGCWERVAETLARNIAMPHSVAVPQRFTSDIAAIIPFVPGGNEDRRRRVFDALEAQGVSCVAVDDEKRAGFSVAVNAGARMVAPSVSWLLVWNDDCIPDDSMVKRLLESALANGLTLAAPAIVRCDESDAVVGATVELGWELHHGGVRPIHEPWVTGAKYLPLGGPIYQSMFIVKREAWEWAGGFDERYSPGYYEDADLVRRLAASGYKCGVVSEARALHFSGSTFSRFYTNEERGQLLSRNRAFYNWKFGQ